MVIYYTPRFALLQLTSPLLLFLSKNFLLIFIHQAFINHNNLFFAFFLHYFVVLATMALIEKIQILIQGR